MRPVTKPAPPLRDAARSQPDELTELRLQLQDTIGYYCSFCEMPITVTQAVTSKHTRVLKRMPTSQDWTSLLLACDYCQLHRKSDVTNPRDFLWPDTDTTFTLGVTSPFVYTLDDVIYKVVGQSTEPANSSTRSMVIVSANATSPDVVRARRTIDLFQLNTPFYDAASSTFTITEEALRSGIDRRVEMRTAAWNSATRAIATLREARAQRKYPLHFKYVSRLVTGLAQAKGFWSVWMTRFWSAFPDQEFICESLLQTYTRDAHEVSGYQTLPRGGSPPWTIFTGTAVDRITF